ncbi:MAG: NAD(P)-binding protein [Spirochaetes bacterium]|nr:NAD(P)-binding protein [Spirochaetota bacterium]
MKMEDATRFTERCINGEPASCSCACPFHLDMRSFLSKTAKGRWNAAYKELRNAVMFPVIVAALCDAPCRGRCQRTIIGDEAIDLPEIESAVIKYANNRKPESYFIPPKTKSVAVIGAGVSGLSCALNLSHKKYSVTVFEKENGWGGRLHAETGRLGTEGGNFSTETDSSGRHASFKDFDDDIALQFSVIDNVEFKYNTEIKSLDELNDFDAVYIATGAGGESFGLIDSWDSELLTTSSPKVFMGGMLCGVSLMEAISHGIELSRTMEVFLQTGKAFTAHSFDRINCGRYLDHSDAVSSPIIKASLDDGYTEEEAKQEAGRCLQCDCEKCIDACEMLKLFNKKPKRIASDVFTDAGSSTLASRTLTRETYSCNICGYCKSICPEDVDIGALLQFSRVSRLNSGKYPAALHDFWLREMDFATTEGFFASAPKGKEKAAYAFFPGCRLGASNPDHVLKAYEYLHNKYDAGIILDCCGVPAYWAGDDDRLNENLEKVRDSWKSMGGPVLIFACASCEHVFRMFLPEVKFVSLYELLSDEEGIVSLKIYPEAAVFDPCAARYDDGMQSGVRKIAVRSGIEIEELKEKNRCCGFGGHMQVANPSLYNEIIQNRIGASEKPYIVYCTNCREVFVSKNKQCVHILDIAFGLNLEQKVPSLQKKRNNSLEVKKILMKEYHNTDFNPETYEWEELKLIISEEIQESMEKKLISEADLKEAIFLAESFGDKFIDESGRMNLCSLVKPVVTYWVQYKTVSPEVYEIFSVYYHRMRFHKDR